MGSTAAFILGFAARLLLACRRTPALLSIRKCHFLHWPHKLISVLSSQPFPTSLPFVPAVLRSSSATCDTLSHGYCLWSIHRPSSIALQEAVQAFCSADGLQFISRGGRKYQAPPLLALLGAHYLPHPTRTRTMVMKRPQSSVQDS